MKIDVSKLKDFTLESLLLLHNDYFVRRTFLTAHQCTVVHDEIINRVYSSSLNQTEPQPPSPPAPKQGEFKPEPGEMIEVKDERSALDWHKRKFIGMTSSGKFACENETGDIASAWQLARPLEKSLDEKILQIIKEESERSNVRQYTCVNGFGYSQFERNIAERIKSLFAVKLPTLVDVVSKYDSLRSRRLNGTIEHPESDHLTDLVDYFLTDFQNQGR